MLRVALRVHNRKVGDCVDQLNLVGMVLSAVITFPIAFYLGGIMSMRSLQRWMVQMEKEDRKDIGLLKAQIASRS